MCLLSSSYYHADLECVLAACKKERVLVIITIFINVCTNICCDLIGKQLPSLLLAHKAKYIHAIFIEKSVFCPYFAMQFVIILLLFLTL